MRWWDNEDEVFCLRKEREKKRKITRNENNSDDMNGVKRK